MMPASEKPQNVRLARPGDEAAIFALLLALDLENNSTGLTRDNAKVYRTISDGCALKDGAIGVIEEGDKIIGSVGVFAQQMWFSSEWILSELWLYVRPEYRGKGRLGRDLFNFARWIRDDRSAATKTDIALEISWLSADRQKARSRLWQRFARKTGEIFTVRGG